MYYSVLRNGHILAILVICASSITAFTVIASAEEGLIPSWIKTTVGFWISGDASDQEFLNTIEWMLENKVIQVSTIQDDGWKAEAGKLYKENQELKKENKRLQDKIDELYDDYQYSYDSNQGYGGADTQYYEPEPQYTEVEINPEDYCYGTAECFIGTVTKIIDGDTIEVDGQSIRFALVNAPELNNYGGQDAKNFVESVCPVGSSVLVDEDDGQTRGSYGRTIAIVYCNDLTYNLNEAVIASGYAIIDTPYCSQSEFGSHYWPQIYGCAYDEPQQSQSGSSQTQPPPSTPPEPQSSCDPSYPTVCIPPYPPDLNCGEISYKNFLVVGSDPHGFDGDNDGIGCES